jgi:hypothetical protein
MRAQEPGRGTLVPVDPERHALEMRIEHAKARIVEDVNRASGLLREIASSARRGLGWLLVGACALIAGGAALALARRQRRRIRVTWK